MEAGRAMAVLMLSLWYHEDSWLWSFAKSLLRFLAFMFWGAAAALAFGGVSVILMGKNYGYLFQESFLSLPGWLAVAAVLILLPTGVLALFVSVKSSRYEQGCLMYLLLVLLCLEMSSALLAQFYSTQVASELKSSMDDLISQYNVTRSQGPGNDAVDVLQRKLQCCGIQNYTDWLNATAWLLPAKRARVPVSCCKEKYSHCRGDLGHLQHLFQEGCLKKLEDRLHFGLLYVFCCCIVLAVLELLAGVINGILMWHQPLCDLFCLDSCTC